MEVDTQDDGQSLELRDAEQAGASTPSPGDDMDVQMEAIEDSVRLFITPQTQLVDSLTADTHQGKPKEDSPGQIARKPRSQQEDGTLDAKTIKLPRWNRP